MLKRGKIPSVERVQQFCAELGLELYIGTPRGVRRSEEHREQLAQHARTQALLRELLDGRPPARRSDDPCPLSHCPIRGQRLDHNMQ